MKQRLIIIFSIVVFAVILAILFLKSLQIEQQKKDGVLPTSTVEVTPVSDSDWIKGQKGKISIIEYSDLQCPACKAYYPLTKQLVEEFKDSITFVYRHFPLRKIHFNSQIAAQAAEAAGLQGKFWEMHDLMFDKQEEWEKVQDPKELFSKYAKDLGLDLEKFKSDLNAGTVKDEVEKDYQGGLKAGVNATPTFFINGKKIQNPKNFEEFKSIIQQEIDKNK